MAEDIMRRHWSQIRKLPNVIGYAKQFKKRIRNGKEADEMCIRIYVTEKVEAHKLKPHERIPRIIESIPTDVVDIGELEALVEKKPKVDKTKTFRPLVAGISIGNEAITAGTLGWFVEHRTLQLLASNAHVFVDDPSKDPSEVTHKRILQPGPYDGGIEAVATYFWHKRIYPENSCWLTELFCRVFNTLAKWFGRKTRLIPQFPTNRIDFAVAAPTVQYDLRIVDVDLTPNDVLVGFGFAGSDVTGVVCKIQHIVAEGFVPIGVRTGTVEDHDEVWKSGRTSCYTTAKVIDSSAHVRVSYGNFRAEFDDVILTTKLLEPGDSGSAVWKREVA